jgi:hypothetical protein
MVKSGLRLLKSKARLVPGFGFFMFNCSSCVKWVGQSRECPGLKPRFSGGFFVGLKPHANPGQDKSKSKSKGKSKSKTRTKALGYFVCQRPIGAPVGSMMMLNQPMFGTSWVSFMSLAPRLTAFLLAASMSSTRT